MSRRTAARASTAGHPRQIAFDVVRAVSDRGAYANILLPERLAGAHLSTRDAAFATELTYGSLRWSGTYDAIIDACATRGRIDPTVRDALRIGAHQLFATRVPEHAAVTTTVELVKARRGKGASGFANAVMRAMAARSFRAWLEQLTSAWADGSDRSLALRHGHPPWLVTELRRALTGHGRSDDDIELLLAADNRPARVTLAARPGLSTVAELVAAGAHPGTLSPFAAILSSGDPADVPAVREGRAGVQDEGSQLVVQVLARAAAAHSSGSARWLDMCAGPGGKAALLAALAPAQGAELEAWELHEHRAGLVRRQVPSAVRVRTVDATEPTVVAAASASFDMVLLDAPCTGLGALRRRPEARWRKRAADVPRLARRQRQLLHSALTLVRPGGLVGYVTCSPLLAETRDVVTAVVESGPRPVGRVDPTPHLPGAVVAYGDGLEVQLWPHLHGTDAMFLTLLRPED